jgi:cytochrome c oxidase subunit 2
MARDSFKRSVALIVYALALCAETSLAADEVDIQAGATLWKFCAFCHNADGLGQERSDAPKVAGDPAWYTERQLTKFRSRVRGSHPEDLPGMQMIVYAYPLIDEAAIRNMAAFIETMPAEPEDPAPDRMVNRPRNRPYEWDSKLAILEAENPADAERGAELYATTCTQCHGAEGEGIEALGGPRLDNKQDWYLIRQLKYFKYGARGTHEDDIYGRLMAELGTPETDQDIVDIVAHIKTLSKGPLY